MKQLIMGVLEDMSNDQINLASKTARETIANLIIATIRSKDKGWYLDCNHTKEQEEEDKKILDGLEFARTVAVARILMPCAHVRLSAGRAEFTDELQALCFVAGANSIFYGDTLLTTENPEREADQVLFSKLGLKPEPVQHLT